MPESLLPSAFCLPTSALENEQQLAERLPLVPPPDPVVGSILADFGAALALERTLEHAVVILELAQQLRGSAR